MTLAAASLDVALDANGDFATGADGGLYMIGGLDGVVQLCRIALAMVCGEWFLDLDRGVKYFEREGVTAREAILGQKFDAVKAAAEFRRAILGVPDVVAITRLDVSFDAATRAMSVAWSASTAFGDTPVDTLDPLAGFQ